ncbi:DUF3455 domain-containing protein [Plantactinospora siamensis]|uniref:DUF3455 domain-containing protein n=1 Tax=Plantactinospora siamensis TaxID=555372 RepID=A0ABV6P620_9ACTN
MTIGEFVRARWARIVGIGLAAVLVVVGGQQAGLAATPRGLPAPPAAPAVPAAGALPAVPAAGPAMPAQPGNQSVSVPPALDPPPGQVLRARFFAAGTQVYRCADGAWTFVEPAANLVGWQTDPVRPRTAIHFRGPSWESTEDGSLVEARAVASVPAPAPGTIPQLLLQATANRGTGIFGQVSYVQRLATSGGAAPAGGCAAGATTGVPYRAEYRFYVPGSA